MQNFPSVLDERGVTRLVLHTAVRSVAASTKTHLLADGERWTWQQLRDYTVAEIESRQGVQAYESPKLIGIFKGFSGRWGDQASAITRYAFEVCDGIWVGRPVTVTNWCKGADPFFATPIAERLAALA